MEEWRERFLLGAENALRARPRDEEALREEEINRLKRKVGELVKRHLKFPPLCHLKFPPPSVSWFACWGSARETVCKVNW